MSAPRTSFASVATRIAPALFETVVPIADLLASEHVETRVAELVAESGIETHPGRL